MSDTPEPIATLDEPPTCDPADGWIPVVGGTPLPGQLDIFGGEVEVP